MRINKYLSQAGIASRRKADDLIRSGNIKVNGAVMKEPGYDVKDEDVVEVNGRPVEGDAEACLSSAEQTSGSYHISERR